MISNKMTIEVLKIARDKNDPKFAELLKLRKFLKSETPKETAARIENTGGLGLIEWRENNMRYDARIAEWNPMQLKEIDGYFTDVRVEADTIPSGFNRWEIKDGDCNGLPYSYKPNILVNFYGTFITKGELPIDDEVHHEGFIDDDEWNIDWDTIVDYSDIG